MEGIVMTDRELMQQALEALKKCRYRSLADEIVDPAITALNERLAQPEQEPVAYTTGHCENHKQKGGCQLHNLQCGWPDCDRKPITAPPQRKPLTDEQIAETLGFGEHTTATTRAILTHAARAIEAKLKEKNNG
jgi:hypothetical protein